MNINDYWSTNYRFDDIKPINSKVMYDKLVWESYFKNLSKKELDEIINGEMNDSQLKPSGEI
tara:strand:- start:969 stop:1154 length:186 start_codon:yes stop_codon:yes gene_type:complete